MKYDIFFSYRRSSGGKELAIAITSELESLGYKVFLDLHEIVDDKFGEIIDDAISQASVFIILLSDGALDRCSEENDWVRHEILEAIRLGKHIIPINPDGKFVSAPGDIPQEIIEAVNNIQRSEIMFGSLFKMSVKKMADERILPYIKKSFFIKRLKLICTSAIIIAVLLFSMNSLSDRKKMNKDLVIYQDILERVTLIMNNHHDSLFLAENLLSTADSIQSQYKYSRYIKHFADQSVELRKKYEHCRDSLFSIYLNQYRYYYQEYLMSASPQDKAQAINMIERALAIKHDPSLQSIKNDLNL